MVGGILVQLAGERITLARLRFTPEVFGVSVQLAFGAEHATSFKVFRKGPGQTEFAEVADVLLPGEWTDTSLAEGTYEYYVQGVNSRGTGAASAPVSVVVAAAAAA